MLLNILLDKFDYWIHKLEKLEDIWNKKFLFCQNLSEFPIFLLEILFFHHFIELENET